jgi:hypothetical protein
MLRVRTHFLMHMLTAQQSHQFLTPMPCPACFEGTFSNVRSNNFSARNNPTHQFQMRMLSVHMISLGAC